MDPSEDEIMGGVGFGAEPSLDIRSLLSYNQYQPLRQEPAGRNYRPDQFPSQNIGYPAWDADDPMRGIMYENSKLNFSTPEQRFVSTRPNPQPLTQDPNAIDYVTRELPPKAVNNDFGIGNWVLNTKERMTSSSVPQMVADISHSTIMMVLIFILFIVIAYLQNQQIGRLQSMVERLSLAGSSARTATV
jgi:hypothetical protein